MASAVEFLRDLVIDSWSPLSHKRPLSDGATRFPASLAPTWVPAHHRRRLDAYRVLAAYSSNVARLFLPTVLEGNATTGLIDNLQSEHREYGDADLLIDRVMAGVLGDAVEIVVEGADEDLPDAPELPPEPPAEDKDAPPILTRVHQARVARWEQLVTETVDQWEADLAAQPGLIERQEWLRQWADDEQLNAKLVETERDIIGLGDGVYVLAWSTSKQRPVVDIYDPGFYFPVLTDTTRDFPTKIHLAWEYVDHLGTKFVRRLTWELAQIGVGADGKQPPLIDVPTETTWPDGANTRTDAKGRIVRQYPWNFNQDGKPTDSHLTCYFTDATWRFGELDGRHVDDFDETKATFATNEDGTIAQRLDLRIDFLPVLHVPNTPAHREHFGKSTLAMIAQILDDVAASDTDIQAASALAAGPVVGLSGSATLGSGSTVIDGSGYSVPSPSTLEVRPGSVWNLGENGKLDIPDLSKGLTVLVDTNKYLREHMNVNSRVPGELTGRVSLSQAASGVSIALRFGPFNQLVGMLRLTREPKGKLLLKMAQRLGQAGGVLDPGPNPEARLEFGSFLPSDRNQLVTEVNTLLEHHAISHQTAVQLLVAGGLPIEDARHEVDRIRADNPTDARQVADATGSEELGATWLGLELPDTGVTPPNKPGAPPAPSPAGDQPAIVPPGATPPAP